MGILALSALVVAGTGFILFSRSFTSLRVNQKKVQQDLTLMEKEVRTFLTDPVSLHKDDLEVLSYNVKALNRKSRKGKRRSGIVTSIFEEPLVGYSFLRYNAKNALMVAVTKERVFYYWLQEKGVTVVIDDQVVGTYHPKSGILTAQRSGKEIAQLDKTISDRIPVLVQGEERASMKRFKASDLLQRTFDYASSHLTKEQEALLLTMVLFEVIQREIS
ncbi:MAG: hypothetical protein HRU40_20200 [Saprospiraceae bacterium]|nr:hypothetical protein [Saprospiraceae bacterium]